MTDVTMYHSAGGCSCKASAKTLGEVRGSNLSGMAGGGYLPDDAAIVELPGGGILLSSVDFQNPILPDAKESGRVAAFNAASDILACGARPRWAEVILALPDIEETTQVHVGREFMEGIAEACRAIDCEVVGGHTVVLPTPLIGLAVRGIAAPGQVKRKSGARVGDIVVLTKPIGLGIAVAAHNAGFLSPQAWDAARETLLSHNGVGASFGDISGVTSLTDVTGFGLLGHAMEVAEASGVCIDIEWHRVPLLPGVKRAAAVGHVPLLASSNWDFVAPRASGTEALNRAERLLLADPQTNGGLLATVHPDALGEVASACAAQATLATAIGRVTEATQALCRILKE